MKPKTPKARVMWATQREFKSEAFSCHPTKDDALYYTGEEEPKPVRVAVIPLDDVEAIVAKVKLALVTDWRPGNTQDDQLRVALTAAGIPCKQRRARK